MEVGVNVINRSRPPPISLLKTSISAEDRNHSAGDLKSLKKRVDSVLISAGGVVVGAGHTSSSESCEPLEVSVRNELSERLRLGLCRGCLSDPDCSLGARGGANGSGSM